MEVKKLLIDFQPGTTAYERNRSIRDAMDKVHFSEIVKGRLIGVDGDTSDQYFENQLIEQADKIEIYYK